MNMLQPQRHSQILHEIELRGSLNVAEFSERVGVSGMTIRRDLVLLEEQGLVERVHGGAVRPRRHGASATARMLTPLATLGMVVPSAGYYFPEIIRGAKAAVAEAGARLVLGISEYSPDLERSQVSRLANNKVDGILVTPSRSFEADPSTFEALLDVKVPVVVVERALDSTASFATLSTVRSNHAHGAELAVAHLLAEGRQRVALARRPSPTAPLVQEGYRRALAASGSGHVPIEFELPPREAPVATLRRHLEELLDTCRDSVVDALIVLPDEVAISLLEVAEDRGIAVPEDLALVAYDDEVASIASVPLTAVAPPKFQVGYFAARTCLDQVLASARGSAHEAFARVELFPVLSERESSRRD
ncbi:DeoR/GlpR family transcriptional regulator [Myceligenerans salitolerans]|uniref:DeoR/GlpR family transcriptional regulator n=2 Tax=Myceligenerans salitolerans TaxID=1230528 RepID=A0ABS3IBG7_9MICO|nr:DeoR/GlpR family transcriptional regulator [Myceligenerans salitolerans]